MSSQLQPQSWLRTHTHASHTHLGPTVSSNGISNLAFLFSPSRFQCVHNLEKSEEAWGSVTYSKRLITDYTVIKTKHPL